jgi:hypothetical protein
MKTTPKFFLTGKCFPLTNFSNYKQTQESLESGFQKATFHQTNTDDIGGVVTKASMCF